MKMIHRRLAAMTMPFALALVWTVTITSVFAAEPGTQVIFSVFDAQPVTEGMSYETKYANATTVVIAGQDQPVAAWQVKNGNVRDARWERAFRFRVTDPAFQNGGRRAVDIEIQYMLETYAGVEIHASTAQGWTKIGSGWGDSKGRWRTARIRLDNAWFGPEKEGKGGQLDGGWDLEITGANAPMIIRSVTITGYDPEKNVRWDRMLRIDQPRPINHEGDRVFVFRRRNNNALELETVNLAKVPRPLAWRVRIGNLDDQIVYQTRGAVTVEGDSSAKLHFPFDSTQWPVGAYQARVELLLDADDKEPILSRDVRLGVIDDGPWALPKAADDEFFFGLDAGNNFSTTTGDNTSAEWYALMGVDVLRGIPVKQVADKREKIQAAMVFIAEQKLRAQFHIDPPKPTERDAKWRQAEADRRAQLLAWAIETYGGRGIGKIPFVELGNEPDLPFFWGGDMASYYAAMKVLADGARAGKKAAGLSEGAVLIANGGLSFAGKQGYERSHEFVKLVEPGVLDALAYHAHGPGYDSERHGYERQRNAMSGTAVEGLPIFDTETGYSGTNNAGLLEQARTAVEKLAFAQAKGMPTLFFFRLYMGGSEGGYGLTDHRVEPRPSILTYRHLVQRLRGKRFVKELDTAGKADAPGVVAYLFHGQDQDTWTLLAFSTQPASYELNVRLAATDTNVSDVAVRDLFGNLQQARLMPGNVATLPVGVDAVYLTWRGGNDAAVVDLEPPLLALDIPEPLPTGNSTKLNVSIRNPSDKPLAGKLIVEAVGGVPIRVLEPQVDVRLDAGQRLSQEIQLVVGESVAPLDLPQWWRIFPDADPEKLNDKAWATMPQRLPGVNGKAIEGRQVWARDGKLDFSGLPGGVKEKRSVVGFAIIDSPADVTLPAAASADWWMAWYVNGQQVYSTLATGNRHGTLADHTFDLPLKKGRNVIAFQCLSGSGGWALSFGGPRQRALALSAGTPLDRVHLTLVDEQNNVMAQRVMALPLRGPVPPLGDVEGARLSELMPLEPLATLGASAVTNHFTDQPDASRWYGGEEDLSAIAWLRDDQGTLKFIVAVRDGQHEPARDGAAAADTDAMRLIIADHAGKVLAGRAYTDGKRVSLPNGETMTQYVATIAYDELPADVFRLSMQITDRDAGVMKQTLGLGNVATPAHGVLLHR